VARSSSPAPSSARDAHGAGLRFTLRDIGGSATVQVVYRGSVPDLFPVGSSAWMRGRLRAGVFVGTRDSLGDDVPLEIQREEIRTLAAPRRLPAEAS